MIAIKISNLCKVFHTKEGRVQVLSDMSTNINAGEVTVIRGENGCGKTTLLHIIAGLLCPTSGNVVFPEEDNQPKIGFVFQNFSNSLMPWRKAIDNICLPLEIQKKPKRQRYHKADKILDLLGFDDIPLDNYPHQLSGGQKHRVAIARSLTIDPSILLLDEPFANLDIGSERRLQKVVHLLREKQEVTVVLIAHNIEKSIMLSDRILMLSSRPARIIDDIIVRLPRPRKETHLYNECFFELRKQILEMEDRIIEPN